MSVKYVGLDRQRRTPRTQSGKAFNVHGYWFQWYRKHGRPYVSMFEGNPDRVGACAEPLLVDFPYESERTPSIVARAYQEGWFAGTDGGAQAGRRALAMDLGVKLLEAAGLDVGKNFDND